MQTYNLDIHEKKTIIPVLHAKQGDVGRKFKVVLTDGSAAYAIPEDAELSVWYSGTNGAGHYSSIDGTSAITISGNTAEVELIAQMLNKPGAGLLCLVISESDGDQIGLWNIPYAVECVPGVGSAVAEDFYTSVKIDQIVLDYLMEHPPAPGYSPTVTKEATENGYRITIQNEDSSESFEVFHGQQGPVGPEGPQGPAYELTEEDKAELVGDVLQEMTGGIALKDRQTGTDYAIYMRGGALTIEERTARAGTAESMTMTDRTTGATYRIYVEAGNFTMEELGE